MEQRTFLSEREELRALWLAQHQPKSAQALQELFAKVEARAAEVVLKDPKVAERLKGVRFRVVGSGLRDEKPAAEKKSARRLGEGGIYDYDRNVLVVPIVDLRKGVVVGLEERSGLQPPLATEEVEQAKKIVLSDPRFQSLKKRSGLQVVAFPARAAFSESHPYYGHRCFTLYFWSGGKQPKKAAEAVVDLSTQQLLPADASDPAIEREEAGRQD